MHAYSHRYRDREWGGNSSTAIGVNRCPCEIDALVIMRNGRIIGGEQMWWIEVEAKRASYRAQHNTQKAFDGNYYSHL
jgi:hypothetical protein